MLEKMAASEAAAAYPEARCPPLPVTASSIHFAGLTASPLLSSGRASLYIDSDPLRILEDSLRSVRCGPVPSALTRRRAPARRCALAQGKEARLKKLSGAFGKFHGLSSLFNLIVLGCIVSHGWFFIGSI